MNDVKGTAPPKQLGDPGASHAQTALGGDHLDPLFRRAIGDASRRWDSEQAWLSTYAWCSQASPRARL